MDDPQIFNEAKLQALRENGYRVANYDIRSIDFSSGFRAGVEWAEEYGDCSIVRFFVEGTKEAKESYKDIGDDLSD